MLGILGAHEMGHYLACRYYRVDATLPYFIPLLIPFAGLQTGTLGAVIRIREPFPTRKVALRHRHRRPHRRLRRAGAAALSRA